MKKTVLACLFALLISISTLACADNKFHVGDILVITSGLDEGRVVKVLRVIEIENDVSYVVTDAEESGIKFYGAFGEEDLEVFKSGVHIHFRDLNDHLTKNDLRQLRKIGG